MHLVLLAAAASLSSSQPPPSACRVDAPVVAGAAVAYRTLPRAGPRTLAEMPPAHEVRAVRRLVDGCDYAEVRTPAGWTLKSDQQLATMAGYPKPR